MLFGVTDAPVTHAPVTDGPVTDGPVTDGPLTDGPVTDGSVTGVTVNGAAERFTGPTTVEQVVQRLCASSDGVAVARNGEVVPRSAWTSTALEAGDHLEILTAAAGG
jgi:sulfur carrier protein